MAEPIKMQLSNQMRLEQQMKLAPHMIQSMEILQLPILALQERIEQELNSNPVLELVEPVESGADESQPAAPESSAPSQQTEKTEDFDRIEELDDDYSEYVSQADTFQPSSSSEEVDKKLEAIKNTAAPPISLHDFLDQQWALIDAPGPVKKAGYSIIDYIDARGYLSVRLEQLHNDKSEFSLDDLVNALALIQKLEPVGVGARDLKECLLIQLSQAGEDVSFEIALVKDHLDDLLENRLPEITKKMKCSIEQVNQAVERLRHCDTSPGLRVGPDYNKPVTPDIIVEESSQEGGFSVRLAYSSMPSLKINDDYFKMAKDPKTIENTKKFLQNNIRSARWIIDAIQQRNNTLLRVARSIVQHQREFFEKGKLYLRPLPMAKVAEDVGVHVATVSRAVSGKYLQCSWGILPLRKFFSGGTEDTHGNSFSWEAVRGILQNIIDNEDKSNPLNDDQIKTKLSEAGFPGLARRTIAKYRKLLNIPAARFRRKF